MIFNFLLRFLYQIFPGTTLQCQRLLFKAAKTGELDTVQKLVRKVTLNPVFQFNGCFKMPSQEKQIELARASPVLNGFGP